jgi:phosphatidylserine/phosphatidylglycerophosphate/cardiolipin synthase-like enzyme
MDQAAHSADGLSFKAYRGDSCTLLAFDLAEQHADDLAGFAVEYTDPAGRTHPVLNRLSFDRPVTARTTPTQRRWTPTLEAPLQKFHWVHFPQSIDSGPYTYRATAMLFRPGSDDEIEPGPSASVTIGLMDDGFSKFELGFTRGYISSQAYAERFKNAPIEPSKPPIDFSTAEYERRYRWLGFHGRRLIFDFLNETIGDPQLTLDVFAFDLNEPDVVRALEHSKSHVRRSALELAAAKLLAKSAGDSNIETGHFGRLAHNKVLIQKRRGAPVKVLAGSANFSVRGLYVQSNNVFVFDDAETANLYEQAFEQAWTNAHGFGSSPIAARWFNGDGPGLPAFDVSFSPHANPGVSLDPVAEAITKAQSSVLFSVMEIGAGSGPVLDAIRALSKRKNLYAFGTTQRLSGALKVTASGRPNSPFIPFAYLQKNVPQPFQKEWGGGSGEVIHHKFVVTDFNDLNPAVFAGSSNLAAGGERGNGDNLVAFYDRSVATTYAVEAIRLIDHYRFRAVKRTATKQDPLRLRTRRERWARDYYNQNKPQYHERLLFVR